MKQRIVQCLRDIEENENVKIIFAVESGSRAWGFESDDSDYDVRFVYVRPLNDYLKLEKRRDVIEYILNDELDINGWDLDKALKLLGSSNPTLFEWLYSSIVYHDTDFYKILKKCSCNYFSVKSEALHYFNMALRNYKNFIEGKDQVILKKYFYVLRPMLAAQWVLEYKTIPPVLFHDLVNALLDEDLINIVNELIEQKGKSTKGDLITPIKSLNVYIEETLEVIKEKAKKFDNSHFSMDELNKLFIEGIYSFHE